MAVRGAPGGPSARLGGVRKGFLKRWRMRSVLKDDILADEEGEKVYPGRRRRTREKGPTVRAPLNPGGRWGKCRASGILC